MISSVEKIIQIQNLSVRYGDILAIDNLSLEIKKGEFVLITGASGCGKSTLARALSGLIPHAIPADLQGSVWVAGHEIGARGMSEIAGKVGVVFQNPATQLFHLHVEEEVAFGPANLGLSQTEVSQRVEWALEATGMSEFRNRKPFDLSGGQKQRVAIAAVVAMQPEVLVLDEPTASLDVEGTLQVMETLKDLNRRLGITILLIEHRLADATRLAQRMIVMEAGSIIKDAATDQVLSDRVLLQKLGLRRPVEQPLSPWSELLVENHSDDRHGTPLLELQQVSAGYDQQAAVIHQIDLKLMPGEFAALVGSNGAGKTTLGLVAAGLIKPSQGKVRFNGGGKPRPGLDVSLLFQNPAEQLFTDSVEEEVAFGPQNYHIFDPELHEQVLEQADLRSLRARRPFSLSVGQQQRAALAACLSLQPALLILDEPTLGQDWGHLQRLMDFLVALNRKKMAILLITHDYKLVHHYAERVIYMEGGRIVLDGHIRQPKRDGASRGTDYE
jgi:energy-coupling factor transport system ATP-binding protein